MAVSLRDTVKINDFVNLSKAEEVLPKFMTRVKSVRVSTVDKIVAEDNDNLFDVDLLKGVKLIPNGYVTLAGLAVSGEWNLPSNCKGGVSICLVDKRMLRTAEATIGSYSASACNRNFSFKLIPNYAVTSNDAERRPWQVLVNIRGVAMEKGWCPLSLEFVSVCIVHKNNVKKGLREKVTSVKDGSSIELTEEVVDEFFEGVPMAARLANYRNRKNNNNKSKIVNKGFSRDRSHGPATKRGYDVKDRNLNEVEDNSSEVSSISF